MALQAYSLARDGSTALSPHFCVREFRCKDGSDPVFIDTALAELLERIREHFGKPVTITSAYRTPAHNAKAGGAKFSQHLYGRAADIRCPAIQVLAELCPACLGVVCRGAVGAGDRHRFSEVLPDTLQQFCQRRVDEDRVAAVLAAELPHTEVRREGGAAVPGKRIRLQCHRAPPYSRFSSAAMGSA